MKNFLLALLLGISLAAGATDRYVNNVTGNTLYDGTSPTHTTGNVGPWLSPKCSVGNVGPGYTVHLAPTNVVYTTGIFCTSNAGTLSQPIIFDGADPANNGLPPYAYIGVTTGQAVQVQGNASYLIFQHLYVTNTATSGSGFFIGSSGFAGTVHHVSIRYNVVSFAGGACVQEEFADYVTTHDNTFENCGSTSNPASVSNISYLAPTVVSGDDGKLDGCYDFPADMVVTYGTAYRNCVVRNYLYYGFKGTGAVSDGNGIIFPDDGWCSQFPTTNCNGVNYPYAGLVAENIIFSTDGRGIHFYSSNTTVGITRITHNTIYNSCQGGAAGPCNSQTGAMDALGKAGGFNANGVRFDHNVIYSPLALAAHPVAIAVATGGVFQIDCNYLFGGSSSIYSDGTATTITQSNNLTTNPNLANPSTVPAGADWRFTSSTPALPAGC